jgi:hypothetical protein
MTKSAHRLLDRTMGARRRALTLVGLRPESPHCSSHAAATLSERPRSPRLLRAWRRRRWQVGCATDPPAGYR